MPVGGVRCGKGPDNRVTCYSSFDIWVIGYVYVVIEVCKFVLSNLLKSNKGGQSQDHINQKNMAVVSGLLHQFGNNIDLIKFIFAKRGVNDYTQIR